MAKVSAVEKNKRRRKMADQYAGKRAELKATVMDRSKPIEERFKATLKLAELPRNSAKVRIRNRCEVSGRPRGYYRKLKMSRIALRDLGSLGRVPGRREIELVRGNGTMSMSDPLGDMLTRIRNGIHRSKDRISTPASKLRGNVLDVLKSEGYIRDYSKVEYSSGKSEFEIELKYFDGELRSSAPSSACRSRAVASMSASSRFRTSRMASVSRSCRRRRA